MARIYAEVLGQRVKMADRNDELASTVVEYQDNALEVSVWASARPCIEAIAHRYEADVQEGLEALCGRFAYEDSLTVVYKDGSVWTNIDPLEELRWTNIDSVIYDDGYTMVFYNAVIVPEEDEETGAVCFYCKPASEVA